MNSRPRSLAGRRVGALLLVLTVATSWLSVTAPAAVAAPAVSDKLVPLQGAWWGSNRESRESQVSRQFDIINHYHDWNDTFPTLAEQNLANGGRYLKLNFNGRDYSNDANNKNWCEIANGSQDENIRRIAGNIRAFAQKVFLSFHIEPEAFDGWDCTGHSGTPFTDPNNGNRLFGQPAQFADAWRHIHDVFAQQGVTNAVWVLTYCCSSGSAAEALYPGDAYVDWIAWDPYNFYTCHNNAWTELVNKTRVIYDWARTSHPGKYLMLGEFNSQQPPVGDPNSKGDWFRHIPADFAAQRPLVKALIVWDSNTNCNFVVDSSADSLAGYTAAGHDPYFNQPHGTPPIAYVGTGSVSGVDVTALQAVLPAATLASDLVLLDIFTSGFDTNTVSPPAGFTEVPGSPAKSAYGKVWRFVESNVDAATAAPLLTFSPAHRYTASMHAFRYANGIGPSASAADSVIDTDATAVPSTVRTAGQLLAVASGERSAAPPNATVTPGSGFTERAEVSTAQTSGSGGTLELATKPVTVTSTAGGELFTPTGPARDELIVTALNPSP